MVFDSHKNLAVSSVATAPSPATSGGSLVVATGEGARFSTDVPYNVAVWADGEMPDPSNAEIVRVTAISTDTLTITRAQEGTSARTIAVGDLIAMTVTAKTLTDIEREITWFNVKSYGAVGDGVADDTAALQAAIDAATAYGRDGARGGIVYIPSGLYSHTGLTLATGAQNYVSTSLRGDSALSSILRYDGPDDGVAILVDGLSEYRMEDFQLTNGGVRGTTVGVLIDATSGSGTQSNQGVWFGVSLNGFDTNLQLGGSTSTSELLFMRCQFKDATYGVVLVTFNTLNISFVECDATTNDYGYYLDSAAAVHWYGGNTGQSIVTDFYFNGPSVPRTINGIRSEDTNRFIIDNNNNTTTLVDCIATLGSNVDDILIDISHESILSVRDCEISGKIVTVTNSWIELQNSFVRGPQFVYSRVAGTLVGTYVTAAQSGYVNAASVKTYLSPFLRQIGVGDGTLTTTEEVSYTGGKALYGNTPVDGTLSTPRLRLTTSPTAGYVLTADADGDGTWQAAGAASVSFATHAKWE